MVKVRFLFVFCSLESAVAKSPLIKLATFLIVSAFGLLDSERIPLCMKFGGGSIFSAGF